MLKAKGTHLKVLNITHQSVFLKTVIYDDNYGFQSEFRCRQLCGIASNCSPIAWNCVKLRVNYMASNCVGNPDNRKKLQYNYSSELK